MITKKDAEAIKHEVASDLVREYRRAEGGKGIVLTHGIYREDYLLGWRAAIRSCATRMGVYDEFCELLEATEDET